MNILLIDATLWLVSALRALGHTVETLSLTGGIYSLPAIAPPGRFDLILQQEHLGPRTYLAGLERAPCPTLFWALDVHLNLFWHRWYGQLFDAVLTPHVSLFTALPAFVRNRHPRRFAWAGTRREWRPHSERSHPLALCARVDEHRPVRAKLIELLKPLGLRHAQGLSPTEMLALYDDARSIPNECIANETNFRLLEGASCGCLVLSPDVGDDQNALLEPGRELLVYRDGLELLEQARWVGANPVIAEKMGRLAMLRIQQEHLPEHRARALTGMLPEIARNRLTGPAAALAMHIALARQIRNGVLPLDAAGQADAILGLLRSLPPWPDLSAELRPFAAAALAQAVCLQAETPDADKSGNNGLTLCRELLRTAGAALGAQNPEKADPSPWNHGAPHISQTLDVASVCSALALREQDTAMAKAFRALYAAGTEPKTPDSPLALCLAWVEDMRLAGETHQAGFGFIAEKGMLPEDALNWLFFAAQIAPDGWAAILPRQEALLRRLPSMTDLRLGTTAKLCLQDQANWRLQTDYAQLNFAAMRVREGLEEAVQAREKALASGQDRAFALRLKGMPHLERAMADLGLS